MSSRSSIASVLLSLRLSVFLVMLVWTLDKFFQPAHAAQIFKSFYGLEGLGPSAIRILGIAELLLLAGFVVGYRKRLTYGVVFALHAISTLASYRQYLEPFDHLLFFAAWPMLAACFALYSLRDQDVKLTV